jgi:CHAT domain-containing protein
MKLLKFKRLPCMMLGSVIALSTSMVSFAAATSDVPKLFSIGRNTLGESCSAKLNEGTQDPTITEKYYGRSYAITCRNATASRTVGSIRAVSNSPDYVAPIEASLTCGEARDVSIKGFGNADARQCFDQRLGSRTIVIRATKRNTLYVGSAASKLVGPLEQAMAVVSGGLDSSAIGQQVIQPSFALNDLPQPASLSSSTANEDDFSPENALRQGIRLNQQGLHSDASRLLNDAISRLPEGDVSRQHGELELEAALADSNIRFFSTANAHFTKARALLSADSNPLSLRKLSTYEVLHALNQQQFRKAISMLDAMAIDRPTSSNPLQDQIQLAILNQPIRSSGKGNLGSMASDDVTPLQQRIVDSVLDWSRSVALLAVNDVSAASLRLNDARRAFAVIKGSRIDITQSLWLESRIERQAGRIAARQNDWPTAIQAFDRAVSVLRESQSRNPSGSSADLAAALLERADIIARQGSDQATVLAAFAGALTSVSEAGPGASIDSSAVERYLNILTEGTAGSNDPKNAELYFNAVQAIGEPAIARQVAQLQSVVTADPKLGAAFQEREDLSRELSGLRAEIQQKSGSATQDVAALEKRRTELQSRFQALEEILASDSRYQQTNNTPATIADVRSLLREGEVYYKLSTLKQSAFAVVIGRETATIYRVPGPAATLITRATVLRQSIEGSDPNSRRLPEFNVTLASNLYKALAGPAVAQLKDAKRIVVDPSGPLQGLPFAVLVNDDDSARRYQASKGTGKLYSEIGFVARSIELSNALSPRSFVVARKQPASAAPRAFMGFGDYQVPDNQALAAVRPFSTRAGCAVDALALSRSYGAVEPLAADDLRLAAQALGDPNAPMITGADFTDQKVIALQNMSQFAVLHFSTHGFREGQWLICSKSPPALLTSLEPGANDGVLSFDEIARLPIDANLVFLAACDTSAEIRNEELALASGLEETGGSLDGLVRSFLTAKARAVVATYWEANSDAAIQLSQRFYEQGRTSTIGDSLHQGQLLLMSNPATSHPFFWGPYFLVGDSSKSMLSVPSSALPATAHAVDSGPMGEGH